MVPSGMSRKAGAYALRALSPRCECTLGGLKWTWAPCVHLFRRGAEGTAVQAISAAGMGANSPSELKSTRNGFFPEAATHQRLLGNL